MERNTRIGQDRGLCKHGKRIPRQRCKDCENEHDRKEKELTRKANRIRENIRSALDRGDIEYGLRGLIALLELQGVVSLKNDK